MRTGSTRARRSATTTSARSSRPSCWCARRWRTACRPPSTAPASSSATPAPGETQKYDGPYFLAAFLRRQLSMAVVPAVGDADAVRVCLVPRDFVDRRDGRARLDGRALSGAPSPSRIPNPPTVRRAGRDVRRAPGQAGRLVAVAAGPHPGRCVGAVPGMEHLLGLPAEALDYFASPTTYSTANTDRDPGRHRRGVPTVRRSYAARLLHFMTTHPEVGSAAMV